MAFFGKIQVEQPGHELLPGLLPCSASTTCVADLETNQNVEWSSAQAVIWFEERCQGQKGQVGACGGQGKEVAGGAGAGGDGRTGQVVC